MDVTILLQSRLNKIETKEIVTKEIGNHKDYISAYFSLFFM